MTKKIRVLTFGWEFPPHISGGLGTACYGLTKSLLKQGIDILFVVPKAHGDEEVSLINASEVFIPRARHPDEKPRGSESREKRPAAAIPGMEKMKIIPVASAIRPYTAADNPSITELEEWSYTPDATKTSTAKTGYAEATGTRAEVRFRFSGSYGPNLFEEVSRYGEVGGRIGLEHDFDIIHAHDWLTFPAGIAAKKASEKPLVVHIHATEYDRAGTHDVDIRVLAIEREGMEEADRIVAVSEWTRQILVSKYGVAVEKISVVHNAVTRRKRRPANKPSRLGKNMVTFMGRITYQKGPQYFVEAARKVLQRFPDTHFVVAGSGDLLPSMIERIAGLKLSSNFHFTGFLRGDQLDDVWSVSDVYVMPSVSEPFGITPLEAIRSGVPVIVSNQSGVSEVMPDAIKIDFWDIEALAGAICSVLRHKSLAKTLKKQSKKTLKDITWDNAARKLNNLYHEIAAKGK